MDNEKLTCTLDEALGFLPDGEYIHTFMNPYAGNLVGAEWERDDVIDLLRKVNEICITGEEAQSLDHGLAVYDKEGDVNVFIQTKGRTDNV